MVSKKGTNHIFGQETNEIKAKPRPLILERIACETGIKWQPLYGVQVTTHKGNSGQLHPVICEHFLGGVNC